MGLNEKFLQLPKEKQECIIDASIEVFGKNEYKRAVTDDIAMKAGISKGLSFYYFRNKKSLYMYTYRYCFELTKNLILDDKCNEIDDFFEVLTYGAMKKIKLLAQHPGILEFIMRAYYSQNETISGEIGKDIHMDMGNVFPTYFQHIDFSKFKDGVDPAYILKMLVWGIDGYLHELQMAHRPIKMDKVMIEFNKWKELYRQMVYKEEYQ